MMVVKRKHVVIVALVIMIAVAGYLNWSYQNDMRTVTTIGQDKEAAKNEEAKKLGEAQLVNNSDQKDNAAQSNQSADNSANKVVVDTGSANQYFAEARINKEKSRSQAIETLQSIVSNANSPQESKVSAQNQLMALAKAMDREGTIENLIKAKGFKDAAVFINEDNVNIVVQTDGLTPTQLAQIQDIAISQTGAAMDKIKIVEQK